MLKSLLSRYDAQERNEAWVKRLKRYRRSWLLLSGGAVLLILILELQQSFAVNPLFFFLVIFLAGINFVIAEMVDARIESYRSDQLHNQVSEEEARARYAKIGFEPERLNSNE